MPIQVKENIPLSEYQKLSIAFESDRILSLVPDQNLGFHLAERTAPLFKKEYDLPGQTPTDWNNYWDLSNWGVLGGYIEQELVVGAAIAFDTAQVNMLEGRKDLAVLWDIRVSPLHRGKGLGQSLFQSVLAWCKERSITELKIETQNINVGACRFYEKMGGKLTAIDTHAYHDFPHEIQLIWRLKI